MGKNLGENRLPWEVLAVELPIETHASSKLQSSCDDIRIYSGMKKKPTHALLSILRSPRSSPSTSLSIMLSTTGPYSPTAARGKTGRISFNTMIAL